MAADSEAIGGGGRGKVRHGLEDGAEVPARSKAAERDATKAYVANATGSVADTWEEIRELLVGEPELQPKTLFEHLQRTCPGQFHQDGQVRTLRRRIRYWLATEGPRREVFFAQEHRPG